MFSNDGNSTDFAFDEMQNIVNHIVPFVWIRT